MLRYLTGICVVLLLNSVGVSAQEVRLTPDKFTSTFHVNGIEFVIARNQDVNHKVSDEFAKTSRPCPPFCIHPISAAPGVETVGEMELLDFLENQVAAGDGLLIDSRVPVMYQSGSIPGAVNIPFSTLNPSNPFRGQILEALGARKSGDNWNFSGAVDLALFCNGPWCDQSPRAIRNLAAIGYPVAKLRYYRGGMQMWNLLGLTVKKP